MDIQLPAQHLIELRRRVRGVIGADSWWRLHGREFFGIAVRIAVAALWFAVFAYGGVWMRIVAVACMSYLFYGVVIKGTHESRHGALCVSPLANRIWAYVFADFLSGQSNEWWHYRHVVVHHAFTNVLERDPQLFFFPGINKYVYFFVLPFLTPVWVVYMSIVFLSRRPRMLVLYVIAMMGGVVFQVWLFALVVPVYEAMVWVYVMRALCAPLFLQVAVFNHIGLDEPERMGLWLPHQAATTRNVRPHWFVSWFGGSAFVECHVEHHVFPTLSDSALSRIRPVVRAFLEEHNYVYVEETYGACLRKCLSYYDSLFARWRALRAGGRSRDVG